MSFKNTECGLIPDEWDIEYIDNLKASGKNAIAMGPFGSKIKKESFVEYGVPVIRGNNLKSFKFHDDDFVYVTEDKSQELKASWVKAKDIVITHRGTLGQVGFIPEKSRFSKYIVSQSGMKLTCDDLKINSKFLYYYLNSSLGQHFLLMNTSQVGVPAISQASTSLKKIPVPIPSRDEQDTIEKVLTSLDEKIEVNNRINKTLEAMAQEIFKRWFVDFEFPNVNGDPYKSSGGEMVESEMGMIPKGWEVKEISELCTITSSKRIFMNEYVKEGIPFYRGKEIIEKSKGEVISTELYITTDKYNEIKEKFAVPRKGDILLTSVGTLGVPYKVNDEKFYFKDGNLTWFKDYIKKGYSNYLYLWLLSAEGKKSLEAITIGSTQKALTIVSLKKLKLVVCDDSILMNYEQIISSLIDRIYCNNTEKSYVIKLRDAVLPKLMSGEIRVTIVDTEIQ